MNYIKNKLNRFLLTAFVLLSVFSLSACGDPTVEVTDEQYEPKIVVEAYLYAGETVKDIKLSRNFRLGEQINLDGLRLTPSANNVVVTINDIPLEFDSQTKTYFNNSISIGYNTTYELKVSAIVEGQALAIKSVTTTPAQGFSVANNTLGTFKYRQQEVNIEYTPSPGTEFYAFSFLADSASLDNFIYDNPFEPGLSRKDVEDNFNAYYFQASYITNINSNIAGPYTYTLKVYDAWFFSSYTATIYAGDANFKAYVFTAKNVTEFDGNFHEPEILFQGPGCGVFASAIREKVTFTIVP